MPRFVGGPFDGLEVSMDQINQVGLTIPPSAAGGPGLVMPGTPDVHRILSGELPAMGSKGYTAAGAYPYQLVRSPKGVEFHFTGGETTTSEVPTWNAFQIGYGPQSSMPTAVRTTYQNHSGHNKGCVLEMHSDSAISGPQAFGSRMFHGVSLRDSDTLAVVAGAISDFLSATHDPGADVLGLVFVNFQPSTHFSVRPRPHTVLSVPDLAAGLRSFSAWVVGSIQDLGSPCEWVMLYSSRRPIKTNTQQS